MTFPNPTSITSTGGGRGAALLRPRQRAAPPGLPHGVPAPQRGPDARQALADRAGAEPKKSWGICIWYMYVISIV